MSGIDPRIYQQDMYTGPVRPVSAAGVGEPAEFGEADPSASFTDKLEQLRRLAVGDLTRETDLRGPEPPRHIQWGLQYSAPSQLILMHQMRQQQADDRPPESFRGHL